jgi:hypothetical protein
MAATGHDQLDVREMTKLPRLLGVVKTLLVVAVFESTSAVSGLTCP